MTSPSRSLALNSPTMVLIGWFSAMLSWDRIKINGRRIRNLGFPIVGPVGITGERSVDATLMEIT